MSYSTKPMRPIDAPEEPADAPNIRKVGGLASLVDHPTGFWFIFWGELAERCSYYGMMSILARFISEKLELGDAVGNNWVSYFKAACYFLPLLGGFLADNYLGKYWLIVLFSVPYILGHGVLTIETVPATLSALALLALGSGIIKPNISTLMGMTYDQKRPGQEQLRSLGFGMFYMAINIGALVSFSVLPIVRDWYGYSVAFLCPAVLMALSFVLFAAGKPFYATERIQRHKATAAEWQEKIDTLKRVAPLFLVITFFWAIFDQSHTTWVYFARDFTDLTLLGWHISPEQVGMINPLLIIVFVPLIAVFWTLLEPLGVRPRATDKIMIGFILTAITMGVMALSGYLAGPYRTVAAVKAGENAPYVFTEPDIDVDAVAKFQKEENNKEKIPTLTNLNKAIVHWNTWSEPLKITKADNQVTVNWGKDEGIVVKGHPGAEPLTVTPQENHGLTVASSNGLSVEYLGKGRATKNNRIVAHGEKVSIWWEVLAFVTITLAEVLISITGLELAFVVSPPTMKSFVTALWLLTVGIANLFINAHVGGLYQGTAPGDYFAMLTGMMLVVIVVFVFVAIYFNRPKLPAPAAESSTQFTGED